jgi:hypothetical protein
VVLSTGTVDCEDGIVLPGCLNMVSTRPGIPSYRSHYCAILRAKHAFDYVFRLVIAAGGSIGNRNAL